MEKTIVLNESFFECLVKLGNQDRKAVMNTIKLMKEDITMPSLSVHKIDKEKCDSRFRSARVNSDLRVIFLTGGEYCAAVYVDHHDAAYEWCVGKYYKETIFGAGYIYDELCESKQQERFNSILEEQAYSYSYEKPLFENKLTKKEIKKLGINSIHAENILKITDEDTFMEYITLFPEELQEALIDIYTGTKTLTETLLELEDREMSEKLKNAAEFSLIQKDSGRRFYVVGSTEEIEKMSEMQDFERWITFLHPSQKKYSQMNANGPILIEGGPGTGKTVLGMHRAVYLSQNVYKKSDEKKILFCTYSRKLAKYISKNIEKLYTQKNVDINIDVVGVDSFIAKYVNDDKPATGSDTIDILKQVFRSNSWGPKYSFDFFKYEYLQVIQRYGLRTIEQYLAVDRRGMKVPLNSKQREYIWTFFERIKDIQQKRNIKTFADRAAELERMFDTGELLPMYDSVIIDEAQDLEPVKLRVLSKCVKKQPNNMMILSDYNQRIFSMRSWKNDANVNIVGRTYYLSVNYRMTKEISDYACTVFFQDQDRTEYMRGFKSVILGTNPVIRECRDYATQSKVIIATLMEHVKRGDLLKQICVIFPFQKDLTDFNEELKKAHIKSLLLTGDIIPEDAKDDQVCLCTTKGVKGLEFPIVVLGSSNKIGIVHNSSGEAEVFVDADLKKQRNCERYVAVTRARDILYVTYVEE